VQVALAKIWSSAGRGKLKTRKEIHVTELTPLRPIPPEIAQNGILLGTSTPLCHQTFILPKVPVSYML
jgi:hypothetical protein